MTSSRAPVTRVFLRFRMSALLPAALALTLLTGFEVLYTASEEPFVVFDAVQFSVVVVLGAMTILLWAAWSAALAASIEKGWHVAVVVVAIPWVLGNLMALGSCIHGYLGDREQFRGRGFGARGMNVTGMVVAERTRRRAGGASSHVSLTRARDAK